MRRELIVGLLGTLAQGCFYVHTHDSRTNAPHELRSDLKTPPDHLASRVVESHGEGPKESLFGIALRGEVGVGTSNTGLAGARQTSSLGVELSAFSFALEHEHHGDWLTPNVFAPYLLSFLSILEGALHGNKERTNRTLDALLVPTIGMTFLRYEKSSTEEAGRVGPIYAELKYVKPTQNWFLQGMSIGIGAAWHAYAASAGPQATACLGPIGFFPAICVRANYYVASGAEVAFTLNFGLLSYEHVRRP